MTETFIATNRLRFLVSGNTRTLQQLWRGYSPDGNHFEDWRNVPDEPCAQSEAAE
jgi:hypothetical protein